MTEVRQSESLFSRPELWAACFLDEYAADVPGGETRTEEYDDLEAALDLGDGYALRVASGAYGSALTLHHPGAEQPAEIGWDDLAHWQPHTLRWSETDILCRAAALADPAAPHPGPLLALLGRFTPICTDTDAELAVPLLREAFAALPGLNPYQRRAYADHGDIRAFGVQWWQDPESGWWYPDYREDGDSGYDDDPDAADYRDGELYSPRHPEEDEFPFEALDSLLDRARARCAAVREQPWARHPEVDAAAEAFAAELTAPLRAALVTTLRAAGCADPAVLAALSPDAGDLRALAMTELLLGLEPGLLVRTDYDHTPPPRRYHAHVQLPVPSGDAPRKGPAANLKPHLNAALRAAGLGSTRHGPARVGRLDGTYVDDLPLILIDDWQAATDMLRDILLASDIPPGSGLQVNRRGETVDIPLRPDTPREPDR